MPMKPKKKMETLLNMNRFYVKYKDMENISINSKFNALPDSLKEQAMDFIDSLLERKRKPKNKKKWIKQ